MAQIHEVAKSTILLDGKQAEQELQKLEKQAREYAEALAKANLDNDLKKAKAAQKGLKDTQSQIRGLKKELFDVDHILSDLSGATLPQLNQARRKLISEMRKPTLKRNTKEWKEKAAQLRKVKTELNRVNKEMRESLPLGTRISRGFNKVAGIFTAVAAAVTGAAFSIARYIEGNTRLSDTLSDVEKKTGLTKNEVKELSGELKKVDTRSSRKELLGLAAIGGKLGIQGKENLEGFTIAADKLNVALNEDLGGDTEETIRQVGKLVDLFNIKDEFGMEEGLMKVGSAINEVGQSSTANEAYLVNFARRVGGMGNQAGIALPQIFGIGSALDQLGQAAEMSSTAINKVLISMFKDTADYAQIAGMGVSEFKTLLEEDANEAFVKFLEGLNGNNEGLSVMAGKLDGLGLDGARAAGVLSVLASNTKLVRQEQNLANDAFTKGTSLQVEFDRKNDNLAAKLAKVRKRIRSAFVSSGAISAIEKIVGGLERWTRIKISAELEDERVRVNMLVGELTDANVQEDRRREILVELKKLAPEIVDSLTDEGKATVETTKALREYNKEMINKIILSRKDEDVEKQQYKVATFIEKRLKLENRLREMISGRMAYIKDEAKLNEYNAIWLDESLDLRQKALKLQEAGMHLSASGSTLTSSTEGNPLEALGFAIENERKANEKLELLFDQRKQLYDSLFSQQKEVTEKTSNAATPGNAGGGGGGIVETTIEKDMEALEKLRNFLLNDLKEAYLSERISREEYATQTYGITLNLLEKEKAIRLKYQKDASDIDGQILDHKIELFESIQSIILDMEAESTDFFEKLGDTILDEDSKNIEAGIKLLTDKYEREKELSEKSKELARKEAEYKLTKIEQYANAALGFGDAIASGYERAKNRELAAAGDNDKKKEEIEKKYAERQQRISAFQAAIEGYVEIARINSNAGVNADLTQTLRILLTTAAVARTGMTVGAILSEQYATGKYPVVGPQDGKTYNATWVGKPKTGFFSGPSVALFNENPSKPELVVDGATTHKLIFDYPEVYNAVRIVASGGIPQFAEGKYPDQSNFSPPSTTESQLISVLNAQAVAIAQLNQRLDEGIDAKLTYQSLKKNESEMSQIFSKVNI